MAVTAQAGIFGFGPQSGKGSVATEFYRHKATTIDLGMLDDIRVGPLEIGSGPFPTFPYKAGYIVGGGVEMQPRLEDSIGWLLYAVLGDVDTTGPTDGWYKHSFMPLDTDLSFVRWLTLRKYIPMKEGDLQTDLGEEYEDCKPVGLTINLMNDQPLTARWDFMGRTYRSVPFIGSATQATTTDLTRASGVTTVTTSTDHGFVVGDNIVVAGVTAADFNGAFYIATAPTSTTFTYLQPGLGDDTATVQGTVDSGADWSWENLYEEWQTIPVGCEVGGYIKFTGGGLTDEELPVVGARMTFANQNLDIRQEKVYGSPALEDITILQRQLTFECTIKWNNPQLYRAVQTGSITGGEWSSSPMTGSMDVAAVATALAGTSISQKFELDITSPEIMWQMNGPITLAAGQAVMLSFTGTALEPSSGDYATFDLYNEVTDYTWPT